MLTQRLDDVLARLDIAPLLHDLVIDVADAGQPAFLVPVAGRIILAPALFQGDRAVASTVRHAIELARLLALVPEDPVLAGLMATRCAALFQVIADPAAAGRAIMGGATVPAALDPVWASVIAHQPGVHTRHVGTATARRLEALWPLLGPTEYLIATGGDARLQVDPETGLNTYGCSPRPRPWAITFASSTASSISERGYAAAEATRQRLLAAALQDGLDVGVVAEAARIRRAIVAYYGLSEQVRAFIVPSGTDGELLALGIALLGDPGRPLTNLLVGPDESGSGVPLAAAGRHFSNQTAGGVTVRKGERIDGIPGDLNLASVPVRTESGALRTAPAIMAECVEKAAAAITQGRRVLFHILDQSKTGLLAPLTTVPIWPDHRDKMDLIVDASQARLADSSVRNYIAHDAMVLLTGSKFFTGPPFAGVLLVPPAVARRLDDGPRWPIGLDDYFGRAAPSPAAVAPPDHINVGIALRWQAALAEMTAFAAVDPAVVDRILRRFSTQVEAAIKSNPLFYWHATAPLTRSGFPDAWDRLPTIFTFSVWQPQRPGEPRRLFDMPGTRQIYLWLNADLSGVLADVGSETERRLAARFVHIGQPVALPHPQGGTAGGLRISMGARLVSGEPSHRHLDLEDRIDQEIADVLTVLAKVALIVKYFDRIQASDPPSRFH